jgi:phosphohistidine phosphatase
MIKVYLMRHAIAEPRGTPAYEDDSERPLTLDGRKKLIAVCRGLSRLKPEWDLILTSPYLRAKQTATIVAEYFEISHLVQEVPTLEPGHTTKQLVKILQDLPTVQSLLLIGHEPSLSQHLAAFLFGSPKGRFDFRKAGVACLQFDALPDEGEGTLLWMMGPGQLRRIGGKR